MTQISEAYNLQHYLYEVQQRIEQHLATLLKNSHCHEKLDRAMAYALTGGGKRFRPFLTYAVADIYDVPHEEVDSPQLDPTHIPFGTQIPLEVEPGRSDG